MKRYGSKTLHSGLRHALFSKTASARIPACTGTGCTLAAQFSKRNVLLDRTSKFCMFSFLLFSLGAFAADPRITAKRKLVSNQYESIEAMFDGCDVSGFKKSDIEEVNGVLVGTGISSGVSLLGGATSVVASSFALAGDKGPKAFQTYQNTTTGAPCTPDANNSTTCKPTSTTSDKKNLRIASTVGGGVSAISGVITGVVANGAVEKLKEMVGKQEKCAELLDKVDTSGW